MEAINRYLKRTGTVEIARTDAFIEKALNKIIIRKYVSGETTPSVTDLSAVLIFKDREGPDSGILYTYATDELEIGDTIVKKGSTKKNDVYYLIVEEVKRVDTSVVIRVFNVLETNVLVQATSSVTLLPGYLQSSLRNKIQTSERSGNTLENKAAVLVVPKGYKITIDMKLNMTNLITGDESYSSWLVEGIDDVSTPHINYVHLTQVLKEEYKEPTATLEESNAVDQLDTLTLSTKGGYVSTEPKAVIISRTMEEVIVQVPRVTGNFVVKTKDQNNQIIGNAYIVRG